MTSARSAPGETGSDGGPDPVGGILSTGSSPAAASASTGAPPPAGGSGRMLVAGLLLFAGLVGGVGLLYWYDLSSNDAHQTSVVSGVDATVSGLAIQDAYLVASTAGPGRPTTTGATGDLVASLTVNTGPGDALVQAWVGDLPAQSVQPPAAVAARVTSIGPQAGARPVRLALPAGLLPGTFVPLTLVFEHRGRTTVSVPVWSALVAAGNAPPPSAS